MKILFVSDFTLEQRKGGAQVSNQIIIEKGRNLGHEIIEHDYSSSITDFLSSYDLVIHSNLELINRTNPAKIEILKNIPEKVRLEHDSCSYLDTRTRAHIFTSSKKNFFLSKFHHSFFKDLYGDYFTNVEIVYDPIDTKIFNKDDTEKIYDIVYCGYLHPLKGLDNLKAFAQKNKDRKISVFGWSDGDCSNFFNGMENVEYLGLKSHEEIAQVFKQSKALYHSPIVNEPFCRMVGEALLCGVEEIIGDVNKIGSYLEFQEVGYDEFKQRCETAASNFWSKI